MSSMTSHLASWVPIVTSSVSFFRRFVPLKPVAYGTIIKHLLVKRQVGPKPLLHLGGSLFASLLNFPYGDYRK